jgi:hypothetical protein
MPGLDARDVALHAQHAPQVLGAVEHEGAVHRLPALARCRRRAGRTGMPSSRQIAIAAATSSTVRGTSTPDRLHLVDRGVGRVAAAVAGAEQHLARRSPPQAVRQAAVPDPCLPGDGVHAKLQTPSHPLAGVGHPV